MGNGLVFGETARIGPGGGTRKRSFSIGSALTAGIFVFLGWLFLGGIVAWSPQVQLMAIIGVGIWLLR